MKVSRLLRWVLAMILLASLCFSLVPAFGADEAVAYAYTAVAGSQLKMRKTPSKNGDGCGQIYQGDTVYILEYGETWCKVIKGKTQGYVMTQYLKNIQSVSTASSSESSDQEEGEEESPVVQTAPGFTMDASNFKAKYMAAVVVTNCNVLKEPSEDAAVAFSIPRWGDVDVGEVSGEWCFLCYEGKSYGFVKTTDLFRWDRYDPYVGDIPNLDIYSHILWVNRASDVRAVDDDEVLWTVNPGAAIACNFDEKNNRYIVPIERELGWIPADEVAYVMDTVPWDDAQSGDLISTMTTFFSVGIHTLQFQNRNWNLHVACTYINGTVLQPGQTYNQNTTIGPYTQSSNYKQAPTTTGSGYGGGTCQVNSTFYITTIALPLHIIQRQVHQNVGMHYCKIGLDASVGSGNNTLRMQNTLPYAIRYHYFISDGVLTCAIFRD